LPNKLFVVSFKVCSISHGIINSGKRQTQVWSEWIRPPGRLLSQHIALRPN